jgi:hypothetical protein
MCEVKSMEKMANNKKNKNKIQWSTYKKMYYGEPHMVLNLKM